MEATRTSSNYDLWQASDVMDHSCPVPVAEIASFLCGEGPKDPQDLSNSQGGGPKNPSQTQEQELRARLGWGP